MIIIGLEIIHWYKIEKNTHLISFVYSSMNFFDAIKSYYTNSFNFSGSATRLEYFYSWLFWVLFYFLLNALRFVTFEGRGALVLPNSIVYIIVVIIISFPFISLIVRRLHDINLSGLWSLLLVITVIVPTTLFYPLIGSMLLLCGAFLKGDNDNNRFGNNPLV